MIEVENLSKRYRDHLAVDRLSFRIDAGELVGFLGPNGAGKSTTMRILTGYMPASEGRVTVAGEDVFEHPMRVKKKVGYLPELTPVYRDMTVRGYLRFVGQIKGLAKGRLRSEVDRVAEAAGISHVLPRLIRNVSKGYRQRVGMAQALLGDPEVLILDEPTVGLDPIQIEEVRSLLRSIGEDRRRTVLMSTHILSEVKAVCQRIIMIASGRIVADAPLSNIEAEHGSLEQAFAKLAVVARRPAA